MSHPKGTKIFFEDKHTPVEDLSKRNKVSCFDIRSMVLDKSKIRLSERHYVGILLDIKVNGKKTVVTGSHKYTVKFNKAAKKNYITYLMRKGNWWRVGISRAYDSKGFGLKARMRHEDADEAWALGVYSTKLDAICAEQVISCKFGIPQTHWNAEYNIIESPCSNRTHSHIESIYNRLCLDDMAEAAYSLLRYYGRDARTPFIVKERKSIDVLPPLNQRL